MTMMTTLLLPLVLLASSAPASQDEGAKATEAPSWLVTFDALQSRLDDPKLRLIDARSKADYDKGHIKGAVWVDAKAAEKLAAKPGGLTDAKAWEAWIAPLGIASETEVLVYDGGRQLDAARLWWLMTYLGVPKVGLIDGNFGLWASEKQPVTTDAPKVEPREFAVTFRNDRHATKSEVLSALESKTATIVDARSTDEYTGARKMAKKGGHVPTACSLEWNNLVDKNGKFLNESELKTKLAKAGVKPGEPVITHCQGGGRSSVNAFVLERMGFKTRNYYLGWSEWGNAEETPVEVETEAKK